VSTPATILVDREVDLPELQRAIADAHMNTRGLASRVGLTTEELTDWKFGSKPLPVATVREIENVLDVEGMFTGGLDDEPGDQDAGDPALSTEHVLDVDDPDVALTADEVAQVAAVVAVQDAGGRALVGDALDPVEHAKPAWLVPLTTDEEDQVAPAAAHTSDGESESANRDAGQGGGFAAASDEQPEPEAIPTATESSSPSEPRAEFTVRRVPQEPRYTIDEILNARDAVAEAAVAGFEDPGTGPFEVAEQLLRKGLIDVAAAIKAANV